MDKETIKGKLLYRRSIDPITDCWNWTGAKLRRNYGGIKISGRLFQTHRLSAWIWLDFDIESKLYVLHDCDNSSCFNPEHLFIGTHEDNMRDMILKDRVNSTKMKCLTNKIKI